MSYLRNALERDADHPIEVTRHYRAGGPGYLSAWQRAAAMGQNELFSTGIKLSSRAAEIRGARKNPGVTQAAYRSGLKEARAVQLGKLARIGLRTGHSATQIKSDLRATGRFTEQQITRGIEQARNAEQRKKNPSTVQARNFHPMRGHVEDGTKIIFRDGDIGLLEGTMRGWVVKIHGIPVTQATFDAYLLTRMILAIDNNRIENPIGQRQRRSMKRANPSSTTFIERKINELRAAYNQIERVDPDSASYQGMIRALSQFRLFANGEQMLAEIANAEIRWVSYEAAKLLGYDPTQARLIAAGRKRADTSTGGAMRNPRRGARRAGGSQALSAAFRALDSARGRLLRDVVSSGERRNPKQPEKIAFRVDKRGKLLAYRFSEPTYNAYGNWYRIGLDDAKLKIATGEALEVDYDSQITSETVKRPYKRPGSEPIEDWPLASELVNPGGQAKRAVKLYESFSGKRAKRQNTVSAPDGTPAHVAKLGTLRLIKTSDGRTWKFNGPGAPILAADHRGKLHVVGGQYRANPPDCECGEIVRIEYETDKPHLDQPTAAIYYHELGEETGERPILTIDNEGHMHIEGGAYSIEADGIHN